MKEVIIVKDLKEIIKDLPDDTKVSIQVGVGNDKIYELNETEYRCTTCNYTDNTYVHKKLYLKHT